MRITGKSHRRVVGKTRKKGEEREGGRNCKNSNSGHRWKGARFFLAMWMNAQRMKRGGCVVVVVCCCLLISQDWLEG